MKIKNIFLILLLASTAHMLCASKNSKIPANVRTGTALGSDENAYLAKRSARVKDTLEKLLSVQLTDKQVPRIAICASGGGYRAMLNTLGSLQTAATPQTRKRSFSTLVHLMSSSSIRKLLFLIAQYVTAWMSSNDVQTLPLPTDTHGVSLLDATTYCAGVSGSTWAIAGWIQSRTSLDQYTQAVATDITENLLKYIDIEHVLLTLGKKYASKQPLSIIDIYGVLLSRALLSSCGLKNPCDHTLSMQQEYVATAMIPFPIYTAIIGEETANYEWIEFNPFEVSCPYLNATIPSWSFGRTFSNGTSQDFASEQSLGYCMGIWGSALSMNAKEFINIMEPHLGSELEGYFDPQTPHTHENDLQEIFAGMVNKSKKRPALSKPHKHDEPFFERRFSPARVANWAMGTPSAPLTACPLLTLIDAGIDMNLPMPPLLRPERAVDIVLILDASDGPLGKNLLLVQQYAKDNKLKFPVSDVTSLNNTCSVYKDLEDPECPVVIYMPLVKNENYQNGWDPRTSGFTIAPNFAYTREQSELLVGLAQCNMQESYPIIVNEIKKWAMQRQQV